MILTLAFAVGYNILPTERVSELLFKVENLDETKEYESAVLDFDNDYDRDNPASRSEALKKGENCRFE